MTIEQPQLEGTSAEPIGRLSQFRAWMRRVMPRVAIAAGALYVLWLFINGTAFYQLSLVHLVLGITTFLSCSITILYYGFKILRWFKRKLMWRVRSRLIVTYLFAGLTPIVLLFLLGMFAGFGLSGQGLARIVATQVTLTQSQTLQGARSIVNDLARAEHVDDDRGLQEFADQRASLLRASLPGARLVIWRGSVTDDPGTTGLKTKATVVSDISDAMARGVSASENERYESPLPGWLRGRDEWTGLVVTEAGDGQRRFGAPSFRSLIRGTANGRAFVVMVVVPVSRLLIQQYRDTTGLNVRPFFGRDITQRRGGVESGNQNANNRNTGLSIRTSNQSQQSGQSRRDADQFGEKIAGTSYPVLASATNWADGRSAEHVAFLFDWSIAIVSEQLLGTTPVGELWSRILQVIGIVFLVFETIALLAAAWMTRAVTGTVHKLHAATDYIRRGDFSYRVKVRSHDQLGELAEAFNAMSANIEGLMQERVMHERLEREVEIAADVQARLFPGRVPDLVTVELAAECRAARGVAGDYYDYIEIAPGLVALALGDVSGKGISASLVMSNLQASLRAQTTITSERISMVKQFAAANTAGEPGDAKALARVVADAEIDGAVSRKVKNINHQLCASTESNRFATFFLALYEDRSRLIRYTNAGHNPPVLVRADGSTERLTEGGMMVGAFDWAAYDEATVKLECGDLLLIFSDGITEARDESDKEYGEGRLIKFAINHRAETSDQIRLAIFEEIERWSGQIDRGDDQTLVIVKGI